MVCYVESAAFVGIDALRVFVEADMRPAEKRQLLIIGLPDSAVRESKDRVLSALQNSGHPLGNVQITINLAPGDLRKEGPLYDLPIACALLAASSKIAPHLFTDYLCIGELSLSGKLLPLRGALSVAQLARRLGKKGVVLPKASAKQAAALPGIDVFGIETLSEAVAFFQDPSAFTPEKTELDLSSIQKPEVDFSEIKGQESIKRALEIAAAGNHNILLYGPPGSGKSLLAKALCGILPDLTLEEALEITQIHSLANSSEKRYDLLPTRPFRSPHHSTSFVGLIGGGSHPKPGEITLAHRGVLFLDELPEFARSTLECLRQPLEDGKVSIARASSRLQFPSRCLLIAAMNPCPCGYLGHPSKACRDSGLQIERYKNRISGPLLDRIDMQIEVPVVATERLLENSNHETSASVRTRVTNARKAQLARCGLSNAELLPASLEKTCALCPEGKNLLQTAATQMSLSARSLHRLIKVARTCADLDAKPSIEPSHLMEALSYRQMS